MRQLLIYIDVDTDDPRVAASIARHLASTTDNAALPCKVAFDSFEVWTMGSDEVDAEQEMEKSWADVIENPQSKEGV